MYTLDARGNVSALMGEIEIVLTNDDGIAAEGLHAATRAVAATGIPAVVVAPAENRSGAARLATYDTPVALERMANVGQIDHHACSGTPVDCVRAALLGDAAPDARLIVSGINHGPNLGDDSQNSGTVGSACEGALLGAMGLAISQQHFDGHFHILDAFDPTTPVYDSTAKIAALFAVAMLERPGPDRAYINVNVPARITEARVEVTRLGRRVYPRGSVPAIERDGMQTYFTFGERGSEPPDYEDAEGSDFGALAVGRVSATPMTCDWRGREEQAADARDWTREISARVQTQIPHLAGARTSRFDLRGHRAPAAGTRRSARRRRSGRRPPGSSPSAREPAGRT